VSSIRLFILGSFDERGPMHGHGLLLLAEEEHTDEWTDFAPSAVYAAMKRLAAEELLVKDRVEKPGNYPKRQFYRISERGERALSELRTEGLTAFAIKPDPFDLALARLDPAALDSLPIVIEARLARLREGAAQKQAHLEEIIQHLTLAEIWAMRHQISRWRSEADWHEELLAVVPEIIADEKSRRETT
jgi:DNA-binding PadR family transcriptional regulator